jgi:hypothetical protein
MNQDKPETGDLEPAVAEVHLPKILPEIVEKLQVQVLDRQPLIKRWNEAAMVLLETAQHGSEYPIKQIEVLFASEFGTPRFGFAMAAVNEVFGQKGFHLTMAGTRGKTVRIEARERAVKIVKRYQRDAQRALRKAITLGSATLKYFGTAMDEEEKRKLARQTELAATRYLLTSRIR